MNMVFSPRRSNRIAPINNVIIPPIKIPENTGRSVDTLQHQFCEAKPCVEW